MHCKIGSFRPKSRVFLAPMVGLNDIAFRTLCKRAGAGLVYAGMVSPLSRERLALDDKPAVQLFTESGRGVEQFIKKHNAKATLFDLNLGCAAPIARKHKFGSYLDDLKVIENAILAMRRSTSKPVTLKMRKSANAMRIAALADKHCDALCIHPRTRTQGYGGEPDIAFALKVRDAVSIPVIYSGNATLANATQLLDDFDFVMIGRAALGNPCIFSQFVGKRCSFGFVDYLKLAEKHKIPVVQMKVQAMHFARSCRGAKALRLSLSRAKCLREIKALMQSNQSIL